MLKHSLECFAGLILTIDVRLASRRDLITCDELRTFILAFKDGCRAMGAADNEIKCPAPNLYKHYRSIGRDDLAKEIA